MPDRDKIVRRDFPMGERGYEPAAVDAHLEALAEDIEREPSGDEGMSDYVQAIIDAAQRSGATIERAADDAASAKEAETSKQSREALEAANAEAGEHVDFLTEHTAAMRDRLDAVGGEVKGLVDSVRAGADRLEVDLTALEQRVSELASTARNATKGPEATPAGAPRREETSAAGEKAARTFAEPAVASTSSTTTAGRPAGEGGGGARDDDVEGARLIALNMALSGASREDTDKYMAENFDLPDRAQLLEEVYGSVER
jgi:hypothetical protein